MPPFLTFLRENARWLAAGALMSFLSSFGQTFFISIFAGQIMAAFALSDGQVRFETFRGCMKRVHVDPA